MNYKEGQKVTVKSNDWYNENKTQNGFIVFRDANKVCTFSPGMQKFCGQTFTVAKVVSGSSVYPDHYTFVEDGGSYKWSDGMIECLAADGTETYNPSAVEAPKPEPKKVETPKAEPKKVETPKAEALKPEPKKVEVTKPETPKAEVKKPEKAEVTKPEPRKVETPKPETPKAEAIKQEFRPTKEESLDTTEGPRNLECTGPVCGPVAVDDRLDGLDAFESMTILLKPKKHSQLKDCSEQAYNILVSNNQFPSVQFDYKDIEIIMSRRSK